jgi:cytosine permease
MEASHDDFCRTPVANFKLRPWWYLLMIEMAGVGSLPVLTIGASLGLRQSFSNLVFSTFAGATIVVLLCGVSAYIGTTTRCTAALLSRITFGRSGAVAVALLIATCLAGWWGLQLEYFVNAAVKLAKSTFGLHLLPELLIPLVGCAMITPAALGIRAIGRLSYFAVPMAMGGIFYAFINVVCTGGFEKWCQYVPPPSSALSISSAITIVSGIVMVCALITPDLSRFAKTKGHAVGYIFSLHALAYPTTLVCAGLIAVAHGSSNILTFLVPPGYTWLIFIIMMSATWAINDCNLYSSSLSLAALLQKFRRSHLAIAAGVTGMILSELHISEHIVPFLTMLGYIVAPAAGVFIFHTITRTNPVTIEELQQVPKWRIAQIFAWLSGSLVGYLASPSTAFGLGIIKLTSIPALDGALTSVVVISTITIIRGLVLSSRPIPVTLSGSLQESNMPNVELVSNKS